MHPSTAAWKKCECAAPMPEIPIPDPAPYTNRCLTCDGQYVLCGRCLEPMDNGQAHGLGECAPKETGT